MLRLTGYAAAAAWFALALVTLAGPLRTETSLFPVNFAMAGIFAGVGGFLCWRTNVLVTLSRQHPDSSSVRRLLGVETVASVAALIAGILCLSAALFRVFGEGMAVFG